MTEQWYYSRDGQQFGPFSVEQLRQMAAARQVLPTDLLWKNGMNEWAPGRSVAGIFATANRRPAALSPARQEQVATRPERRPAQALAAAPEEVVCVSRPVPADVRPVLPRNTTNCINRAEAIRDQLYDYFMAACKRAGTEGLVVKSHPYVVPVSLQFECWVPHQDDPNLRDRSHVTITIEPKEFHRYDHVLTLDMHDNQRPRKYTGVVGFTERHADAIVRHFLRQTSSRRPTFGFTRLRTHSLQFWRPGNKLVRLKPDLLPVVATVLCVVGIPLVGLAGLGLLLLGAGALLLFFCAKRPGYVISSGKPPQEPRMLLRLDSWQTLIPAMGRSEESIRTALVKEFSESRQGGIQLTDEIIWQWGVDGIEERRQLVGRLRRGQGFIHVYRYGDDLFVGWDTHVNAGDWAEKDVAAGIDPRTGEFCRVKTIQPGWRPPQEYDLIDTICLGEWIHGAITKVVKRVIKENAIDAEIDFKIDRGERQGIVGRQNEQAERAGRRIKRGLARMLSREG